MRTRGDLYLPQSEAGLLRDAPHRHSSRGRYLHCNLSADIGARTPERPTTQSTAVPDPEQPNSAWSTGFVRKNPGAGAPNNPLACFQVPSSGPTAGSLSFQLQAPVGAQFRGFALCAQYIQLTNISTHDIRLDGMSVTTDQGPLLVAPWPTTSYLRAAALNWPSYGTNPIDLRRIPGATVGTPGIISDTPTPSTASTATYPINYGTYVICMSEESYERQWTAQNGDPDYSTNSAPVANTTGCLVTNGDGIWGDERNEAYPIYPFGDLNNDQQTMALLMGAKGSTTAYSPYVTIKDLAGDLIAGGGPGAGPGGIALTWTDRFPASRMWPTPRMRIVTPPSRKRWSCNRPGMWTPPTIARTSTGGFSLVTLPPRSPHRKIRW